MVIPLEPLSVLIVFIQGLDLDRALISTMMIIRELNFKNLLMEKEGLKLLNELRERMEKLHICSHEKYNRELLDAVELYHMLDVSFLVLSAGLTRQESRGAHYREDFPARDDDKWLVNIVFKKHGEDLNKRNEKVNLSHFSPESQ